MYVSYLLSKWNILVIFMHNNVLGDNSKQPIMFKNNFLFLIVSSALPFHKHDGHIHVSHNDARHYTYIIMV